MNNGLYAKGNKFLWYPIDRGKGEVETEHPHYGKIVTVINIDSKRLETILISVDDFPQCNGREHKNKFLILSDELVVIK